MTCFALKTTACTCSYIAIMYMTCRVAAQYRHGDHLWLLQQLPSSTQSDKQNGWRYKLVSSSFQLRAAQHSFVNGFDSGNVSTLHVGLSQTVQDRAGLRWCLRFS